MTARKRAPPPTPKLVSSLPDDPRSTRVTDCVAEMPQSPHQLQDFGPTPPVDDNKRPPRRRRPAGAAGRRE
jgi:hypothetical protein